MTDPLDALRDANESMTADPVFAAALRLRLQEALSRPVPRHHGRPVRLEPVDRALEELEEEIMTSPTTTPIRIKQLSPYLAVADGRAAIDFYVTAFGAQLDGEPIYMDDGKLGHATLLIGSVRVFLAEEFPEMNLVAPTRAGGVSVTLHLSLDAAEEVDVTVDRAVMAGARLERAVADGPYGRAGVIVDPAGHRWFVSFEPS